jgi:hypothetical protein
VANLHATFAVSICELFVSLDSSQQRLSLLCSAGKRGNYFAGHFPGAAVARLNTGLISIAYSVTAARQRSFTKHETNSRQFVKFVSKSFRMIRVFRGSLWKSRPSGWTA